MEPKNDASLWLIRHFREFADDSARLHRLMRLTISGISALTTMPRLAEVIARLENRYGIGASEDSFMRDVEADAELAQLEVNEGFPITLSQFLVDIWGLLEAFIRKLLTLSLEHMGAMRFERVAKLKIKVGDYDQLVGAERFYYVVKVLEREEASSTKVGVDRFESLLACVKLDGPLPSSLKKALYELSQLRNCIVHNARRVDLQLVLACPWLALSAGQMISPGHERATRLSKAVRDYSILAVARASARYGDPMQNAVDEVFKDWSAVS